MRRGAPLLLNPWASPPLDQRVLTREELQWILGKATSWLGVTPQKFISLYLQRTGIALRLSSEASSQHVGCGF